MSHHPREARSGPVGKTTSDLDQKPVLGSNTGAMTIGIDLDQCLDRHAFRAAEPLHGVGGFDAVEDDSKPASAPEELGNLRQLHGRDSDGVDDVAHALAEEIARLGEGRDGDRHVGPAGKHLDHLDRFRRLHMRPHHDSEIAHSGAHPLGVRLQLAPVEDQRRCRQIEDGLGPPPDGGKLVHPAADAPSGAGGQRLSCAALAVCS